MKLSQFIGQDDAKLGLILNAIDPSCGGMMLVGGKGSGKSTLARLSRGNYPSSTPFIELPLNVTEESLIGGIDLDQTLATGRRVLQPGIISRANNGVVFIDDINLLSNDLLALVMEPHSRGEEIIEREGLTERRDSLFTIIATMNPEEADLSSHLMDRIGLCAVMDGLQEPRQRLAILHLAAREPHFRVEADQELQQRISASRVELHRISVPEAVREHMHDVVQQNVSPGHRGDIFLYYAARALSAWEGCDEVTTEHVDRVTNLVFAHRRLQIREEDQTSTQENQPDNSQRDHSEENRNKQPPPPESNENDNTEQPKDQGEQQAESSQRESSEREEIMQVGESFKVRRIFFRKDRHKRQASGRRTKTRVKGRGGRYVKSVLTSFDRDIAIDATLRASAPYQNMRGRTDRVLIEQDDLRFRQRERKMGHLVLFVVDGSGSMGVQQRMIETKGAIQSILMDCYQKRDQVAMIVFRKDHAETVLPPTSSVELAAKRLSDLPVGGKTPLAAGLLEAHRVVRRVSLRDPEKRIIIVLITDGRGNHSLTETPSKEEVPQLARLLEEQPGCDFIVVDTENKKNFLKTDKAVDLARDLNADYYTIDALHADYLSRVVKTKM